MSGFGILRRIFCGGGRRVVWGCRGVEGKLGWFGVGVLVDGIYL